MKKYISIISNPEKTIEEYNNLYEEYNQLNEYSADIEDELEDIIYILNKKVDDDDNKKIKYINRLNANRKDYDYINNKIIEIKKNIEKKKKLKV